MKNGIANEKTGLGVVGSGYIVKRVLRELRGECGRLAIYSRNCSTGKRLSSIFQADFFERFEDLLQQSDIECIYIATPHPSHYGFIIDSLNYGKAVICEKPIVMNVSQLERINKLSGDLEKYCTEIMWFRYSPLFKKLKEIKKDKSLGNLVYIKADIGFDAYALPKRKRLLDLDSGGGALLDIGIYMISVLDYLLGDDLLSCDYEIQTEFSSQGVDIYDHIKVKAKDTICELECSLKEVLPTELSVIFEKGSVRLPMFFRPRTMIISNGNDIEEVTDEFSYNNQFLSCFEEIKNGKIESKENPMKSIYNTLFMMDELREKSGIVYSERNEKA